MAVENSTVLLLALILFLTVESEAKETCCAMKNVDGKTYFFLREDTLATAEYGCKDGCIYTGLDDVNAKETCFRTGNLNAMCVEETVHLGGCISKKSIVGIKPI